MSVELTEGENAVLGVTAAIMEGVLLQPTLYWKNMRQQNLPLSVDPRLIYRGMGAALTNEAGQMGLQFVITGLLKSYMPAPTPTSDLAAAVGGGMIVALFASPVELVMIAAALWWLPAGHATQYHAHTWPHGTRPLSRTRPGDSQGRHLRRGGAGGLERARQPGRARGEEHRDGGVLHTDAGRGAGAARTAAGQRLGGGARLGEA